MQLENHPTVRAYRAAETRKEQFEIIEAESLKNEALQAGADDVGVIDLERETMAGFREDLRSVMPDVQSVLVMAFRLNQSSIRSVPHSVANLEFKHTILHCNHTARHIVQRLQAKGIKAINMPTDQDEKIQQIARHFIEFFKEEIDLPALKARLAEYESTDD